MKKTIMIRKQQGQALLFVIVALTISLAIGIGVSVRTISSLSRTTKTDTASRALAAAEGGIERYLTLSVEQLNDAVAGHCPDGTIDPDPSHNSGCVIEFDSTNESITSKALVTVSNYQPSYYPFELKSGEVKEVNLDKFQDTVVKICWISTSGGNDISYFLYGWDGSDAIVLDQGGITSDDPPPAGNYEEDGFATAMNVDPDSNYGYEHCYSISSIDKNKVYGLRLRTLGGDAKVGVFGNGAQIPIQGFEITSVGSLIQVADVVASRTIKVVRSLPYLPAGFDFSLYSDTDLVK